MEIKTVFFILHVLNCSSISNKSPLTDKQRRTLSSQEEKTAHETMIEAADDSIKKLIYDPQLKSTSVKYLTAKREYFRLLQKKEDLFSKTADDKKALILTSMKWLILEHKIVTYKAITVMVYNEIYRRGVLNGTINSALLPFLDATKHHNSQLNFWSDSSEITLKKAKFETACDECVRQYDAVKSMNSQEGEEMDTEDGCNSSDQDLLTESASESESSDINIID